MSLSKQTVRVEWRCHDLTKLLPGANANRLHMLTTVSWLVTLTFLLVEFALLFRGCVLVLLILRDKVVHVALGLCELHLVHPLTGVPMEERLAAEHCCEVLCDTLEHLLDRSGVTGKSDSHLETLRRYVADRGFDVVGDPFNKIGGVLVLHIEHLLIDLLGGHAATEERRRCQVAPMAWVRSAHHVLCVEHLLRKLRHRQRAVLLRAARCERCKPSHEEVQSREGYQVNCDLAQVAVQLSREPEARGYAAHGGA